MRPRRTMPQAPLAPDLVQRDLRVTAPIELGVADITYIPTAAGLLYLADILDVFSVRIVGWCMRDTPHGKAVLDTLDMAATWRCATNVVPYWDQGSQYSAFAFGQRCKALGVRPSMGSRGEAYGNAMAERCFSTLECECLAKHRFAAHTAARLAVFRYIDRWYNPHRRHSALGHRSPLAFEQAHRVQSIAGGRDSLGTVQHSPIRPQGPDAFHSTQFSWDRTLGGRRATNRATASPQPHRAGLRCRTGWAHCRV